MHDASLETRISTLQRRVQTLWALQLAWFGLAALFLLVAASPSRTKFTKLSAVEIDAGTINVGTSLTVQNRNGAPAFEVISTPQFASLSLNDGQLAKGTSVFRNEIEMVTQPGPAGTSYLTVRDREGNDATLGIVAQGQKPTGGPAYFTSAAHMSIATKGNVLWQVP